MNTFVAAVFSEDWKLLGYVDDSASLFEVDSLSLTKAQTLIGELASRAPELTEAVKDESGCVVGYKPVLKGDPRFVEALRDELRRVGLRSHIIERVTLDGFVRMNGVDTALREQVIPDMLGLPADQQQSALAALTQHLSGF